MSDETPPESPPAEPSRAPEERAFGYSVKLPTGKATLRGGFGGQLIVTDIAIPLNQL